MAYTVPPGAAQPGQPLQSRPPVVTWASYALYALGALQVISGVVALAVLGPMKAAYEEAFANIPDGAKLAGTAATVGGVVGLLIALLFAAGFVVLGVLDGKGKNPARIVTWVLAGLGVCCFGAGAAGQAVGNMAGGFSAPSSGDQPDATAVQNALDAHLPSWYHPVSTTASVLSLLLCIAVIVLLALPAANEFFRKPQPGWQQPPGYPPIG